MKKMLSPEEMKDWMLEHWAKPIDRELKRRGWKPQKK